jgi:hypothetical protein
MSGRMYRPTEGTQIMTVSLSKAGRHASERFAEAPTVVFVTVDGCVLRQTSVNGQPERVHVGPCLTEPFGWATIEV